MKTIYMLHVIWMYLHASFYSHWYRKDDVRKDGYRAMASVIGGLLSEESTFQEHKLSWTIVLNVMKPFLVLYCLADLLIFRHITKVFWKWFFRIV